MTDKMAADIDLHWHSCLLCHCNIFDLFTTERSDELIRAGQLVDDEWLCDRCQINEQTVPNPQ